MSDRLRVSVGTFTWKGTRPYNEDGCVMFKFFNQYIEDTTLHKVDRALFAIFDGHGGEKCARFLEETLHLEIAKAICDTKGDAVAAMKLAFDRADDKWLRLQEKAFDDATLKFDNSGSTATVCLIEGREVFCAFVGDSPSWILNSDGSVIELSNEHKPHVEAEKTRVLNNGGSIRRGSKTPDGPMRVFPGGLAVSRAFGNALSKLPQFGGKPGALICEPEIIHQKLDVPLNQFLLICSDGVTDNLASKEDIYVPMLQGVVPGLKAARKTLKKHGADRIDLDSYAKKAARNAVHKTVRKDGTYQDNATALVILLGDSIIHNEEEVRRVFKERKAAKT